MRIANIHRAKAEVEAVLLTTDWHMTMPHPTTVVTMIEAKAQLMNAVKKLDKVLEVLDA